MSGIDLEAAILAASGRAQAREAIDGMLSVKEWLDERGIFANSLRPAHLIGQCAHESMGFTRNVENLRYTSAERIRAVFGKKRFPSLADAQEFVRQPKALANRVYGGRLGNTQPGDGWRYRGRGWLQLTGRSNYRKYGRALGLDLEGQPERATEPGIRWQIAAHYLATRKRAGKTALEWADEDNGAMVTRIVNGGTNGLADRLSRTANALAALDL